MTCISLDLTLNDVLTDPMIAAAMRADRVDPQGFERLLRRTARDLDGRGPAKTLPIAHLAGVARTGITESKCAW